MDFSQSKIKHLIIHEIGNKLRDETLFLSDTIQYIDEDLEETLLHYFLKSFKNKDELFCFNHNSDLNLNEVYSYSRNIFFLNTQSSFIKYSQDIAKHLYEYTLHPKIAKGELIIVEIENIVFENESINLIGVFKSEKKDSFLKIIKDNTSMNVRDDKGINVSKIEKACLVLNNNEDDGYTVLNIDNQNQETDYWTYKFLNIKPQYDERHKTKEIFKICKGFADEFLANTQDTNKKLEFNNDFVSYFEDNDSYDIDSFTDSIFKDDDMKKEFFEYQDSNKELFDFDINDTFELSQKDIQKEKKKIKNVIKLDTKLELKVILDKDNGTKNIEKGFDDDKGMSYYKIFFNEEID